MEHSFTAVTEVERVDQLLEESRQGPILIFKHSTTCPISSAAHREMSRVKAPISLVVVQRARPVSQEVEAKTGVRHESPQAIILRDGQAVWSASHYDITAEGVERAMSENR